MDVRETPSTDHDLLVRIWTILEGTNGSGLITRFGCVEKDVVDIKAMLPNFWTREQHDKSIKDDKIKKDIVVNRRKVSKREWLLGVGVITIPMIVMLADHIWK